MYNGVLALFEIIIHILLLFFVVGNTTITSVFVLKSLKILKKVRRSAEMLSEIADKKEILPSGETMKIKGD